MRSVAILEPFCFIRSSDVIVFERISVTLSFRLLCLIVSCSSLLTFDVSARFGLAAVGPGSSGYCGPLPESARKLPKTIITAAGDGPTATTHLDYCKRCLSTKQKCELQSHNA